MALGLLYGTVHCSHAPGDVCLLDAQYVRELTRRILYIGCLMPCLARERLPAARSWAVHRGLGVGY